MESCCCTAEIWIGDGHWWYVGRQGGVGGVAAAPAGLDCFDLDRLEAAVASVPRSAYVGNQKALSELSHSMLLRCVLEW
jgi:hypothetical protein